MCVCVCILGSDTVRANVLPLEQICGSLGQMGLTIASGPKTEHTVLQGSATLAEQVYRRDTDISLMRLQHQHSFWCMPQLRTAQPNPYLSPCSTLSSPPLGLWLRTCPVRGAGGGPPTPKHRAGQKAGAAVTSHPAPALTGGASTHLYLRREA